MTGRGIDQVMHDPGDAGLHERWVKSSLDYVRLAERASGPIPRSVPLDYIWGVALEPLASADATIINLETAVTTRGSPWPGKGIHYRMHPANVDYLARAEVDCCVLANNHVLDWSQEGLEETLSVLLDAGFAVTGAGHDLGEAMRPAVIGPAASRVLVFGLGLPSSGVPDLWAATGTSGGVATLSGTNRRDAEQVTDVVQQTARFGDLTVVSLHWGPNWGHEIPAAHRRFARTLIDGGVHVVHGHSSHHPLAIEVYRDRLILYGCGDLINDYEGISGHTAYRPRLGLVYLATFAGGKLVSLELVPVYRHRFRLETPARDDVGWLARMVGAPGMQVASGDHGRLVVNW